MTHKPLLSICIPTYNGAKYIRDNLDVIVAQVIADRLDNVEVVVSDNCSTDETPTIIAEYVKKHSFIRYSRNDKNILFNGNMLKCCELAEGEFIHFMGDDDFYQPNGIKRIVDVLLKDNSYSVLVASNNWFYNDDKTSISRSGCDNLKDVDCVVNSELEFAKAASYRLWCVSDLIVNKKYLKNFENNMPNIDDWLQISMALYVASQKTHYYVFADTTPILSIRLGTQSWLNNIKGPDIYLNNLKTFMAAKKYGFNKKFIRIQKKIFLKYAPKAFLKSPSFVKNCKLLFSYFYILNGKKIFYKQIMPAFLKRIPKTKASPIPIEFKNLDVFILTYNRANYLKAMLESVCNQTAQGFTIKILDNASTDNTDDVILKMQQQYPHRKIIHIKHPVNIGNPANFKKSQELATNEYTAVFHDDDLVHPEYIENAMILMKKHPNAVMASCLYLTTTEPLLKNWKDFRRRYYLWNPNNMPMLSLLIARLCFAAMIYKTDAYKTVEYHPEKYGKIFDNPFLLEMGTKGESIFIKSIGLQYRIHSKSDSNNYKTGPFVDEVIATLEQGNEIVKAPPFLKQILLYNYAKMFFTWGRVENHIAWDDFLEKCVQKNILTKKIIFIQRNKIISRFFIKKYFKQIKKHYHYKTSKKDKNGYAM